MCLRASKNWNSLNLQVGACILNSFFHTEWEVLVLVKYLRARNQRAHLLSSASSVGFYDRGSAPTGVVRVGVVGQAHPTCRAYWRKPFEEKPDTFWPSREEVSLWMVTKEPIPKTLNRILWRSCNQICSHICCHLKTWWEKGDTRLQVGPQIWTVAVAHSPL